MFDKCPFITGTAQLIKSGSETAIMCALGARADGNGVNGDVYSQRVFLWQSHKSHSHDLFPLPSASLYLGQSGVTGLQGSLGWVGHRMGTNGSRGDREVPQLGLNTAWALLHLCLLEEFCVFSLEAQVMVSGRTQSFLLFPSSVSSAMWRLNKLTLYTLPFPVNTPCAKIIARFSAYLQPCVSRICQWNCSTNSHWLGVRYQ